MDDDIKRVVGAVVGLIAACLAMAFLYLVVVLLMDAFDVSRARVRIPIFLFFLPIGGLVVGWQAGPVLFDDAHKLWMEQKLFRAALIVPIAWILVVLLAIVLFEPNPFDRGLARLRSSEIELLMKIILSPFLFAFLVGGAAYLIRGKK